MLYRSNGGKTLAFSMQPVAPVPNGKVPYKNTSRVTNPFKGRFRLRTRDSLVYDGAHSVAPLDTRYRYISLPLFIPQSIEDWVKRRKRRRKDEQLPTGAQGYAKQLARKQPESRTAAEDALVRAAHSRYLAEHTLRNINIEAIIASEVVNLASRSRRRHQRMSLEAWWATWEVHTAERNAEERWEDSVEIWIYAKEEWTLAAKAWEEVGRRGEEEMKKRGLNDQQAKKMRKGGEQSS